MCTLLFAWSAHPKYRLVMAGNRDEFYDRATAAAHWWLDAPELFGGRDLVAGGTWLGVTAGGRLAALTNYRDPKAIVEDAPSRGLLVSGFLKGDASPEEFVEALRRSGQTYSGYNLLFGEADRLYCYSNKSDQLIRLQPGIYGLSNNQLDTPWPKVVRGKAALARLLQSGDFGTEDLFAIISDTTKAPDQELPHTGITLEWERLLSSLFITSERYGTRSSTILLLDQDFQATFIERSFNGGTPKDVTMSFDWSRRS